MAWDFGCGDVLAGIKLAHAIYEISCVYENRADVRYRNFVNEIQGFQELLKKLHQSLNDAARRYKDGGLLSRVAYNPLSEAFDLERRQMIGDFNDTLDECQTILEKNKQLLLKSNNFFDNVTWHLSQQDQKIDDLRRRIHMHSTKIKLAIDRLSINLLTDIDAKVDDLLDISERNINLSRDIQIELRKFYTSWLGVLAGHEPLGALGSEDTHIASLHIKSKFEQTLSVHAPASMSHPDIPLKEGFDALLVHFEQSFEGTDQTPEKYLVLLKTRWLLRQIQSSHEFRTACPGYYYRRAVGQVEQAVSLRVRGTDIISFDDETLTALPDTAFLIWEPPKREELPQLDPTIARANEQELMRLQLTPPGTQTADVLTVFRQSLHGFRIVLETTTSDGRSVILPQTIYTREDRLVPRYALPSMKKECAEIAIFSRNEETLYRFDTMDDLFAFQTALTGYDVSHHQNNIKCQFSKGGAEALDCTGQIQLWQDPIRVSNLSDIAQANSPIDSFSTHSPQSRQSSFVESIGPTTTISRVADGWEADNVKFPALTIFAQVRDKADRVRFAIIFIELETNITIDPKECNCHRGYDKCPYLCLARSNGDKFPIRILFTALDGQGDPDPNSFDLLPFRLPRDSHFDDLTVRETKYVLLRFATLAEKERFHGELNLRFRIRSKQLSDQIEMMKGFRHRENKPLRSQTVLGSFSSPRRSITGISISQTSSSPPQLGKLALETVQESWKITVDPHTAEKELEVDEITALVGTNKELLVTQQDRPPQGGTHLAMNSAREDCERISKNDSQTALRQQASRHASVQEARKSSTWSTQSTVGITPKPGGFRRVRNKLFGS